MISDTLVRSQTEIMQQLNPVGLRKLFRTGEYQGHTAGLANGKLQCNLLVLDSAYARDFAEFCNCNPKTCPVVDVGNAGSYHFPDLGRDLDIRTDLPLYNIYKDGGIPTQLSDISRYWTESSVAFAIGCSFSFEHALQENGIAMRHIESGVTVPMYRTALNTQAVGPFDGEIVMSMRPIKRDDIDQVIAICEEYPNAHGAPMQVGNPEKIGIKDLANPEWGDQVKIKSDEIPVFWGCGVTTQNAANNAHMPLFIAHAPGAMLVTDLNVKPEVKTG